MGSWEGCLRNEEGGTEHHVINFNEDASYELAVLSDHEDHPFTEESGTYEVLDDVIHLQSDGSESPWSPGLLISAHADTLYLQTDPARSLTRSGAIGTEIYELWGIVHPDTGEIGITIAFHPDGTYAMDIEGDQHSGLFVIRGSGLVFWPTQPDTELSPGVWSHVRVGDDELSYAIGCGEFGVIQAMLGETIVTSSSWGEVKQGMRYGK